jgi:hypothetical protein
MKNITLRQFASGHASTAAVLDFVEAKLLEQGRPSTIVKGKDIYCAYTTDDGRHCPVGHLLTGHDRKQLKLFDSNTAELSVLEIVLNINMSYKKMEFLKHLQYEHDRLSSFKTKGDFNKQIKAGFKILRINHCS